MRRREFWLETGWKTQQRCFQRRAKKAKEAVEHSFKAMTANLRGLSVVGNTGEQVSRIVPANEGTEEKGRLFPRTSILIVQANANPGVEDDAHPHICAASA